MVDSGGTHTQDNDKEKIIEDAQKYLQNGQTQDALTRLLVSSDPDVYRDPRILTLIGNCYLGLSQLEKALLYFDQVAQDFPDFGSIDQVQDRRLRISERINDLDKTKQLADQLAESRDLQIQKSRLLFYARQKDSDNVITISKWLLDRTDIDQESRAKIYFCLADVYDKKQQEKQALFYYTEANQIVFNLPRHQEKDPNYPTKYIDFMHKNFEQICSYRSDSKERPVFLVGFPRSGTALLNTVLSAHTEIKAIEEQTTLPVYSRYVVDNQEKALDELMSLDNASLHDLANLYKQNVGKLVDPEVKDTVVDKLPLRFLDIPIIHKIFPHARYIFVVRHPYDCVLSCFLQNFELNDSMANFCDLNTAVSFYDRTLILWQQYINTLNIDFKYVYYENLVNNFENTVNDVLQYLGLEWQNQVKQYQKYANHSTSIQTPSYRQVYSGPYQNSSRWKRYYPLVGHKLDRLESWAHNFNYST